LKKWHRPLPKNAENGPSLTPKYTLTRAIQVAHEFFNPLILNKKKAFFSSLSFLFFLYPLKIILV